MNDNLKDILYTINKEENLSEEELRYLYNKMNDYENMLCYVVTKDNFLRKDFDKDNCEFHYKAFSQLGDLANGYKVNVDNVKQFCMNAASNGNVVFRNYRGDMAGELYLPSEMNEFQKAVIDKDNEYFKRCGLNLYVMNEMGTEYNQKYEYYLDRINKKGFDINNLRNEMNSTFVEASQSDFIFEDFEDEDSFTL